MADLISEIVSQEAYDQLSELTKSIDTAATALNDLAKAGRKLDFSKSKSLAELGDWAEKYEKTIAAMSAANMNYANSLQKAVELKKRVSDANKDEIDSYAKLKAAELDELRAIELREKLRKKAADETEKAAAREEKALRQLNNEYELLKKAYSDAANKAKELGVSFGTTSKIFKDAAANAKVMYDRLYAVEIAVGQGQRAVGQYNQAAFAMQQILRDTPAFAYSFSTGLLAISNNIPILVDRINELKESNKKLVAEGGKALPVWKDVFGAMFTGSGIITLVTAGITILAARLSMASGGLTEAEKAANKLNEKLIELNETISETYEKEVKDAGALLRVIQSLEMPYKVRVEALDELIKKYPQLLGYLEREKLLNGEQGNVLNVLARIENEKARIKEFEETIKIFSEERTRLVKEQDAYEKSDEGFVATWRDFTNLFGNESDKRKKKIEELTLKINDYKESLKISKDEVGFLTNPQRPQTGRIREDIEADIKKYQHIRDITAETDKEHINANEKLVKLNAELDRYLNKKTKKAKEKDTTLKSETDLLRAQYENSQKRLEIERDTNKAISEDTKQEMADRLVAYENYIAATLQLAQLERNMAIDIENEKILDIEEQEKTATGKQLSNLIEQKRAAYYRISTAEKQHAYSQSTITREGQKGILSIVHSSNEEWVKDEEAMHKDLKTNQAAALLVEEAMLKSAYENKEMTRKEFNKRMSDLQRQQREFELQTDIEFDKKILANDQLSAEDRRRYQEKLLNDTKALGSLNKGKGGKASSGRFTDSLAMMFAPADLENEEQYLQAFYDHTIQLANTAADAIIAAKKRTMQAEMDNLDKQKEGIQTNYDMQVALINATGKSEADKANKISQLNAQRMLQEAQIEQKKREIAQKQAAYEKTAAIASIIQNTAVAIAGALKYGTAAPPIIALIAATGAAQLAAAANAPIPAYKEGTDYHKGGMFIAGDGGEPELIMAPNKSPYWSNSVSTLYNEGAGTKVIPMSDIMQYTSSNTDDFAAAQFDAIADKISKSFDRSSYKLAQVIQATKQNINMDAIAEQMRRERNLQGK